MENKMIVNAPGQEYTGLSGFLMTVTRQGVKFTSRDKPEVAAFIDAGRMIKVYDQGDSAILAALQLGQQKWGDVHVSGTDAYKRKCAEIAAQHGIKLANPELQDVMRQAAENLQKLATPTAPLSLEEAQDIIKVETRKLRSHHRKLYDAYHERKKAMEALIQNEPEKPLLLGVNKWRQDYALWSAEKDALTKALVEDLTALGCDMNKPAQSEKEIERQHKTYKERTLQEAVSLHPKAAEVIRADIVRRQQQEREAREAKEAVERQEQERRAARHREARPI
ncbi:MAG: hypothetical protein LBD04_03690, partial [Synergistaceae bacterium]|nr:hypothetical protein [Synergistaceae bacterium]